MTTYPDWWTTQVGEARRQLDEALAAIERETREAEERIAALRDDRYLTAEERRLEERRIRDELREKLPQLRDRATAAAERLDERRRAYRKAWPGDDLARERYARLLSEGKTPGAIFDRARELDDVDLLRVVRAEAPFHHAGDAWADGDAFARDVERELVRRVDGNERSVLQMAMEGEQRAAAIEPVVKLAHAVAAGNTLPARERIAAGLAKSAAGVE